MSNCDYKDEYKDLSNNMRHYANMRFAQLTILIAITAGISTLIFNSDSILNENIKSLFKIVGIIVALLFLIMEERAADYWHHFRNRAVKLEKKLGYNQYSNRPTNFLFTATNASRGLHITIIVLWVVTLIWSSKF